MPVNRQSSRRIRRAVASVEALEARQLMTTVQPDQVPTVSTFGNDSIDRIGLRNIQEVLSVLPTVNGDILAAGYTQATGGHKVGEVEAFHQTDGTVDTSFGTNGIALLDVNPNGDTWATAIGIGANNNIYVAGTATTTPTGLSTGWVTSLTGAGKNNTAFNAGKIETFSFGAGDTSVAKILTLPTGNKFNIVGNSYNPSNWTGGIGIAQFLTTGPKDTSYNGSGIFTTNPGANKDEFATDALYTPDGGIAVSATQFTVGMVSSKLRFTSSFGEALEFKPTSGLNLTFGTGGRTAAVKYSGFNYNFANSIASDPRNNDLDIGGTASDGSYLTGTPTPFGSPTNALPAATKSLIGGYRFTNKGIRDNTFNYDAFTFNPGWLAGANTIHVDASGGVTLSGGSGPLNGASNIAVARLNNAGGFNTFFNGNGKWTQSLSGGYSTWIKADAFVPHYNSLNYQDYYYDYFGGSAKLGTKIDWTIGKYELRYQLDSFKTSPVVPTVGNGGLLTPKLSDVTDGKSIIFQNNNLIIGGDTAFAGMKKFGFLRETSITGSPISTFATNGVVKWSFGNGDTTVSKIASNSVGDILVAGNYVNNGITYGYVTDYMSNGKWRTSFNNSGWRSFSWGQYSGISSMAIDQATNQIYLAGGYFNSTTLTGGAAYADLNSNGTYNTGFGTGGTFKPTPPPGKIETASDLALNGTGGFYAADTEFTPGLNSMFQPTIVGSRMEVMSVTKFGKLDTLFGILGRAYSNYNSYPDAFATRIVYAPKTKIIYVGGTAANGFFAFGTPAPIGAAGGLLPAASLAVLAVSSFTSLGVLNPGFNGNGMQTIKLGTGWLAGISSLALLQNGDLAIAGGAALNHASSQIVRARLHSTGALDTQFYAKSYYVQPVAGSSVGAFDYIIVPHYNASGFLDYYYGFYTGHEKIDSALAYLLIGWDWWCDF
jgi:hypothetical protein